MPPSYSSVAVYAAVANESSGVRCYTEQRHERVHELVEEWTGTSEATSFGYGGDERSAKARRKACRKWVRQQYSERYGAEEAQAYGCPVFIVIAILSGLISWLVQRTLDWMYPRN